MSLNLSNKGITDDDNIFAQISHHSKYILIDLSNNHLKSLPSDLSSFVNLEELNLLKNEFNDVYFYSLLLV